MFEDEEDDEIPEWELQEEKIPASLEKRWRDEEKEGLRAGVCRSCGWTFTKEDLSCRHCGAPTEMPEGFLIALKRFFLKNPAGILLLAFIFASIILLLVVR